MLTLSDAQRVVQAGIAKGQEIGVPSNVAVVDAGGNLLAFARMDGAWLGSIAISIDKAYTARAFDMTTKDLGSDAQNKGALFGINSTNDSRIVIFEGGIPLEQGGQIVGAVGASGGTPDQDGQVAQAGLAALQ